MNRDGMEDFTNYVFFWKDYTLRGEPDAITDFILKNKFLIPILDEITLAIPLYFSSDTFVTLELRKQHCQDELLVVIHEHDRTITNTGGERLAILKHYKGLFTEWFCELPVRGKLNYKIIIIKALYPLIIKLMK